MLEGEGGRCRVGKGQGWGLGEGRTGAMCAPSIVCCGFNGVDYSMQRGVRGRDGERRRKGRGETREKRQERGQTAKGTREKDGSV
jgi:hypothetical protein